MLTLSSPVKLDLQEIPHLLVSACLEVHKQLGPHLMLDAYKECLAHELNMRELLFARDVPVEIRYKGRTVPAAFKFDFIVEQLVVIDVQAFPEGDISIKDNHKERVTTFLKLSGHETALLVNFHALDIRQGIKRLIVSESAPSVRYK